MEPHGDARAKLVDLLPSTLPELADPPQSSLPELAGPPVLTLPELEAGLETIRHSPADRGLLACIVRRPDRDIRELLDQAELDLAEGLVGDSWRTRGSSRTVDGSAHPEMQIAIINARLLALVARSEDRWPLAGDQLVVDLDLSADNLPPGTLLSIGSALLAVTAQPHTGCKKFVARFGLEALQFISSPVGKQLNLRGIYARVVQPGLIRVGDLVAKVEP